MNNRINQAAATSINPFAESSLDSSVNFSFLHFIKFLKENNVFSIAIASILSERINDLVNSLVNHLLIPIINRDKDNDGVRDIKSLEDKVIEINGMKFSIGQLMISLVKFVVITYLVFIVSKVFRRWGRGFDIHFRDVEKNAPPTDAITFNNLI